MMRHGSLSKTLLAVVLAGAMSLPAVAARPETHFNKIAAQSRTVGQTGVKIDRNLHIERVFSQFVVRGEAGIAPSTPRAIAGHAVVSRAAPKPSPVSAPQPLPLPPGR